MLRRGRELERSIVVVTGASSGIGRATAHRFAERGARLVLAARTAADLEAVVSECEARGAEALAVPTDVRSEEQVAAVSRAALARFGRVDTWVNNAGVIAYGYFEDMPSEVFDGVIRTNLLGQVYGARAALAQFRRQGSGVLINLSSVWGRVTSPYVVPYVVSKHGIRAFSECLREGLAADRDAREIHVCTVLPESVDTPIFQHAANYCGQEAKPVSPIVSADRVARAIVGCARRPRAERSVGIAGHAIAAGTGLIPRQAFERVVGKVFSLSALGEAEQPPTAGNVLQSEPELNRIEGGWRGAGWSKARRIAAGAAAGTLAATAAGLIAQRVRHKG
jgi:short-subunit dehydrogenase